MRLQVVLGRSFHVLVLTFLETVSGCREVSPFSTCFCPQSLEIYLKMHFKTFKTSPLSLSVVKRGLSGNFVILSFQNTIILCKFTTLRGQVGSEILEQHAQTFGHCV